MDLEGRGYTLRDGDLREWTRVDVLPVVCKQGVRGSSPLSSIGQDDNSNSRDPVVQQQSTAAVIAGDAAHAFEPGFPLAGGWGLRRTDPRS